MRRVLGSVVAGLAHGDWVALPFGLLMLAVGGTLIVRMNLLSVIAEGTS